MSKALMKKYSAAFKERAVKLAVETEQPMAQTARDLGVNEHTLPTWIGTYHRAERQEQQVHDAHLYDELQRLRKDNARLQEERDILNKAAASCAQQLPCSTPGYKSSTGSFWSVVCVGYWRFRAVAPTSGWGAHRAPQRTLISREKRKESSILRRAVAPTARAGASLCSRRRGWW
jgi:transposase